MTRIDSDPRNVVLALLEDGTPDAAFGVDGGVALPEPPNGLVGYDGGAYVLGNASVLSIDAQGVVDETFAGSASTLIGLLDVAVDGQGRILVSGRVSGGTALVVERLLPDGTGDADFGESGVLTVPVAGSSAATFELAVDAGGGGLVYGEYTDSEKANVPVALGFTASGAVDTGFGTGGQQPLLRDGEVGYAVGMVLTSASRLVTSPFLSDDGLNYVARFSPDGTPDTTFGDGGRTEVPPTTDVVLYDAFGERAVLVGDVPYDGDEDGFVVTRVWL